MTSTKHPSRPLKHELLAVFAMIVHGWMFNLNRRVCDAVFRLQE